MFTGIEIYLHDTKYKNSYIKNMMLIAKQLTSKGTYFLKSIPEDEDSPFYFLYCRSWCLWSVTPISDIKSEKVFDNILGKMVFK